MPACDDGTRDFMTVRDGCFLRVKFPSYLTEMLLLRQSLSIIMLLLLFCRDSKLVPPSETKLESIDGIFYCLFDIAGLIRVEDPMACS